MAVPKKKISRRRRDNRRYSHANRVKPVAFVPSEEWGDIVRPHTVLSVEAYNRKYNASAKKGAKASASAAGEE